MVVTGSGSDSVTSNLVSLTDADRAAIGDENAVWAFQHVFVGASTGNPAYCAFLQRLESARRLANKTITISFWAKASSGTPKIGVGVEQSFGVGGSPSSIASTPVGITAALSSTWVRYSVSATMPSTSGKTLATTGGDFTQIDFWLSCSSTAIGNGTTNPNWYAESGSLGAQSGTVQFWGMQVEVGSSATALEKLDFALQTAACQRFYQTGLAQLATYNTGGAALAHRVSFPVTMRSTPTITPTFTTNLNCSSPAMAASVDSYQISYTATATGATNLAGSWTASADR